MMLLLELERCFFFIHQKVEDNNIRNNIKINNKEQRKFLSNYENQREYSKEFLESLYAN